MTNLEAIHKSKVKELDKIEEELTVIIAQTNNKDLQNKFLE